MRTLPTLAAALAALLLSPAAGASTGGTSAPPEPSGSPGGAEYGVPLRDAAAPAPVARAFRLAPARVTAPALPAVRLRVDQRGSRTVAANVVFAPVRGGTLRRLDLGQVAVGRTITVRCRPASPSRRGATSSACTSSAAAAASWPAGPPAP